MPIDTRDEPCFLAHQDDASTPDPSMAETIGPDWWEGRWPPEGINSLADLERWVDGRLDEMIRLHRAHSGSLKEMGRMAGRQAVKDANRYLARVGRGDHPKRPSGDALVSSEDIESTLEALLRYLRQELGSATARPEVPRTDDGGPEKRRGRASSKHAGGPPRRSWTQPELDAEIYRYKARKSSTYSAMVEGVRAGMPGAIEAAREIYGRNAIARALGVKSPAMVTKSLAWREIADRLHLGPALGKRTNRPHRIGLDIALEEKAKAEEKIDQVQREVIHRETIRLIEMTLPPDYAEAISNQLLLGQITDERARELVEACREPKSLGRNPRAY